MRVDLGGVQVLLSIHVLFLFRAQGLTFSPGFKVCRVSVQGLKVRVQGLGLGFRI